MRFLAIDPGPTESAYVVYDSVPHIPRVWEKVANEDMLVKLDTTVAAVLAIEMVASYGMAVGATVFETCVWAGRFIERWNTHLAPVTRNPFGLQPTRVYRKDVKMHLCGSMRAKDANIRQALIDRYGGKEAAIGKRASPGPLYGMAGDCWAALGVAITAAETT